MKRMLAILLLILLSFFAIDTTACAQELSLSAQAYVLYCVENDTVIVSKNADDKMKMASTTKIMTALLTLEKAAQNNALVTFDESMIAEGSSMYLKVGDTVHLYDLAVGMLMASGNDAANAAAISIAKSREDFATLMNKRAEQIGMSNTNFVTPSGLDDDNHYSTATDMARLMAVALENEQFAQISCNTSMTVDFLTPQKQVTYQNHNRLLTLYDYCISGKTGYTKSAGRCLVTASRKNNLTLVAVTFNAPSDWTDHIKLYEYGFSKYCAVDTDDSGKRFFVDVVGADADFVELYCNKSKPAVLSDFQACDRVCRTVYIPQFLYAPVCKGDYAGEIVYSLDGEIIAQNPLYASGDIKRQKEKGFLHFLRNIFV